MTVAHYIETPAKLATLKNAQAILDKQLDENLLDLNKLLLQQFSQDLELTKEIALNLSGVIQCELAKLFLAKGWKEQDQVPFKTQSGKTALITLPEWKDIVFDIKNCLGFVGFKAIETITIEDIDYTELQKIKTQLEKVLNSQADDVLFKHICFNAEIADETLCLVSVDLDNQELFEYSIPY